MTSFDQQGLYASAPARAAAQRGLDSTRHRSGVLQHGTPGMHAKSTTKWPQGQNRPRASANIHELIIVYVQLV